MNKTKYNAKEHYYNRELSWILFNRRVLGEAKDKATPLFDRLKFLSITASNLDEFFMIRVASLKDMEESGYSKKDIAGLTPRGQLKEINANVHELVEEQYETFDALVKALVKEGIVLQRDLSALNAKQAGFVERYFEDNVYPVLTPMAVDSSRPFPLIRNKSLNIGALVRGKNSDPSDNLDFATVQVPGVLPRFIELPADKEGRRTIVMLEDIIHSNLDKLFLNYDIITSGYFRIMRNADVSIDEEEAEDLLIEIEKQVKKRQWGDAIRLEIEQGLDERLLKILKDELMIRKEEIYPINGPLDLTFLMKMMGLSGTDYLKTPGYKPKSSPDFMEDTDIFEVIREKDILVHHPYQSFDPVVRFVEQASEDPQVLAIKQTLYRVSGNSPIVAALAKAADNGKQVTVLVELKARFDEENNIVWAKKLEKAGCHVIYGLVGLKTHSKITLVVRQEEDGIRRYVHLGTGNYNDQTAKLYTDVGMFTSKESYGEDATAVFNMLSGYSEPAGWNRLSVAPLWLKNRFLYLIGREKENAQNGHKGRIIAKMNSLCDVDIINALYEASEEGVKIDLIIRGICCLRVGIPGVSENIRVRSIVGNFLEHSRIFYFYNNNNPEYYAGSADWMPRNLIRRVEILFPVEEKSLRERLHFILETELNDTERAHILQADGRYVKKRSVKKPVDSQLIFCQEAEELEKAHSDDGDTDVTNTRRFIPKQHP